MAAPNSTKARLAAYISQIPSPQDHKFHYPYSMHFQRLDAQQSPNPKELIIPVYIYNSNEHVQEEVRDPLPWLDTNGVSHPSKVDAVQLDVAEVEKGLSVVLPKFDECAVGEGEGDVWEGAGVRLEVGPPNGLGVAKEEWKGKLGEVTEEKYEIVGKTVIVKVILKDN